MLTDEALDVLALRPGASPSEIKEAYRDLVKVWHPDRFGNDLRLRQKAELQLKSINEAYRVLRSNSGAGGMPVAGPANASTSSPRDTSSAGAYGGRYSGSPIRRNGPGRSSGKGMGVRWIYRGLGISAILLAGYFVMEHDPTQGAGSSRNSVDQQPAGIPIQQPLEASRGGRVVHSTDLNGAGVRPMGAGHSKDPSAERAGLRQFRVRSLSAAETDRLQTLCSRQKELWGQVVYQACLKAQLDVMTNPAGKPDLSALREAERESIESMCSEARRLRGPDSYHRCETEQVASLAAEPARPDLSTLNDADRRSIESACSKVKNREGPAAYHRCLNRMIRTLAEAR
jgi:curved DNA-binding protein CbpA